MDPQYEQVNADEFGGDTTAAAIARNNMRRVEGNKLVNPSFRYQQALQEIEQQKNSGAERQTTTYGPPLGAQFVNPGAA